MQKKEKLLLKIVFFINFAKSVEIALLITLMLNLYYLKINNTTK